MKKNQAVTSDVESFDCALTRNMFTHKKSLSFLDLIIMEAVFTFCAVFASLCLGEKLMDSQEINLFLQCTIHICVLFCFLRKININYKKVLSEWNQNVKSDLLSAFKWFSIICGTAAGVIILFLLVLTLLMITNIVSVEWLGTFEVQQEENYLTAVLLYSPPRFMLFLFSTCVFGPIIEEIIFRRFLYVTLRQKMKFVPALFISSIIFGAFHLSDGIQAGLMGLFLGFIYEKEHRLPVTIFTHGFWNFFATLAKIFL